MTPEARAVGPTAHRATALLLGEVADAGQPADEGRLVGSDLEVELAPLPEDVDPVEDLLDLALVQVAPDAADRVHGVVDAVARDHLEEVHDDLAVAPGVHEEGVEPGLVAGHAEPEEVAVDALELGDEVADVDAPLGRLDLHELLHALDVAGRVGVGADAADPLDQVDVLGPVLLFGQLFQPAVVVAEPDVHVPDDLALDGHPQADRLLEGRVLGSDGDLELHFFPPGMTSGTRSNVQSFRSGKFPAGQSSGVTSGRGSGMCSTIIPNMSWSSRS